jgi:hypothetical protein
VLNFEFHQSTSHGSEKVISITADKIVGTADDLGRFGTQLDAYSAPNVMYAWQDIAKCVQ